MGWLGWPPFVYAEMYGRTNKDVSVDIMCTLANFSIPVRLAVADESQVNDASSMLSSRCPQHSVGKFNELTALSISLFDNLPHTDAWWRDMGAQFLVTSGGSHAGLQVLDVSFKYWGWPVAQGTFWEENGIDENVDRLTAMVLGMQTSTNTDWSHEGGNVDAFRADSSRGALVPRPRLMSVSAVELQRNPHLTLAEIDAKMTASYGYPAANPNAGDLSVLWLDQGVVDDDYTWFGPLDFGIGEPVYTYGTGGHVDEVARWTPNGSVLLTMPSPSEAAKGPAQQESRERMLRNAELLRKANVSVIELPAAPTLTVTLKPDSSNAMGMYAGLRGTNYTCDVDKPYTWCQPFPDGEPVQLAVATSYANFLVSNGVVLMQNYCVPGLCETRPELAEADAQAKAVLQQVYGDREIVGINAFATNLGGGGVHCYTQQQPLIRQASPPRSLRGRAALRNSAP